MTRDIKAGEARSWKRCVRGGNTRSAWRRARRLGLRAARRFHADLVSPRLFDAVLWARDWALRYPPES